TLLPSLMLCITVPWLAFGPRNCEDVCEPCAKAPETLIPSAVTTIAATITFRMRDIFIDNPLLEKFHARPRAALFSDSKVRRVLVGTRTFHEGFTISRKKNSRSCLSLPFIFRI